MILDEGCWLVPRLYDRHLELQKPPLYYWLVALTSWLRGGQVDAWVVRLPAALAGFATVLWTFYLARRSGRPRAGLLAALMLATFVHFTATARVGRVDMPLTFTVALALGGFLLGAREGKRRWFLLAYTALGFGLLVKGPIAVILPAMVVASSLAIGWRQIASNNIPLLLRSSLWGIPWMLALAVPWYVVANWQTDNKVWDVFLWYHNVERALGSDQLASHPAWFYFARLWIDWLPWSLLLPMALWRPRSMSREHRCALLWWGAMLVFLSLMRFKRADYLTPAYPGAALFLGLCLDDKLAQVPARVGRSLKLGFAVLLALTCLGWLGYARWEGDEGGPAQLAERMRQKTDGMVIFFRVEDHALAFHVGRPLDTILEWENLDIWASQPMPVYFVMSPECAAARREHLSQGELVEIERWTHGLRRPLVLLRNHRPDS
jgi:4-amino-4-deoxy-L-arabinose transferase-like glycosyltransferase